MKVLFIGLGSIGIRHLKNLNKIDKFRFIHFRSGLSNPHSYNNETINTFYNLEDAINDRPDFAIISNPTALHLETALNLSRNNIPFLIEKPVSDRIEGLDELQKIVNEKKLSVMVGFQMRQHPSFKKMLDIVQSGKIGTPVSIHGYVGQYLPDWRVSQDYRKSYSASKEMGGGVIFDLCHEIDIAVSLFGKAKKVSCICGHYSDLEIETEDLADITIEHENKTSHIHLNYIERGYEWSTRVTGTEGTVIWNYGEGYTQLVCADGSKEHWDDPEGFNRDWLFRKQLEVWLKVLKGEESPTVTLTEGIHVTQIAIAAKQSSEESRHILL